MSITLAYLISELQSEVPAVNNVPTSAQYIQAIKDAVAEFSRRCGLVKMADLSIVANTATYSFPDDFLKLVSLNSLVGIDGVIISSRGIIPMPMNWTEEYTIANKQITFKPTPTYTLTRGYQYKAGWVLTGTSGSETYATMGDDEKQIVMIKAKGIANEKIMNAIGSGGNMKYSFGAVSVDKSSGVDEISKTIFQLHGDFTNACDVYNGAAIL
jgi:hypothetical protein